MKAINLIYRLSIISALLVFFTSYAIAEYPRAYVGYSDSRDISLSPDGNEVVVLKTDYKWGVRDKRDWDLLEILDTSTGDVRYVHDVDERIYRWIYWPFDDVIVAQGVDFKLKR